MDPSHLETYHSESARVVVFVCFSVCGVYGVRECAVCGVCEKTKILETVPPTNMVET